MTEQDRELLRRPLLAFFTTAAGPVPPQPRPVWFELTADDEVQLFTPPGSLKVRRLERDPRASLVVAAPADEREHWVALTGPVSVETEGARELAERLAARYWDLDDPVRAADRDGLLVEPYVRLVLHPETVRRTVF
ncbi:pyridoxamine 5'-phosphate oxidase family protein [Kineococcus sp. SYSU DK004]|uniref:pyridoxamine 5'-phosphate oxidase family protein n=1 Tax=Kineococcus sp. SYSU DK004 TaxID=3383125 RepID=UPI003D7C5DF3